MMLLGVSYRRHIRGLRSVRAATERGKCARSILPHSQNSPNYTATAGTVHELETAPPGSTTAPMRNPLQEIPLSNCSSRIRRQIQHCESAGGCESDRNRWGFSVTESPRFDGRSVVCEIFTEHDNLSEAKRIGQVPTSAAGPCRSIEERRGGQPAGRHHPLNTRRKYVRDSDDILEVVSAGTKRKIPVQEYGSSSGSGGNEYLGDLNTFGKVPCSGALFL